MTYLLKTHDLSSGATKKELLKENNITHVLTLLDNAQPHFPEVNLLIQVINKINGLLYLTGFHL